MIQTAPLAPFRTVKRQGKYGCWEPIHIATHADPMYDERLMYEGNGDKITQVEFTALQ